MRIAPAIIVRAERDKKIDEVIVRAERDKTIDEVKDMYNNGYWIMDNG